MFTLILASLSHTASAQSIEYLEEKTAFCFSEASLTKYLSNAKNRNIDGMNNLVLEGKCGFVPDGQILSIHKPKKDRIGSMPVVSFQKDDKTLWTFQALVQKTDFGTL